MMWTKRNCYGKYIRISAFSSHIDSNNVRIVRPPCIHKELKLHMGGTGFMPSKKAVLITCYNQECHCDFANNSNCLICAPSASRMRNGYVSSEELQCSSTIRLCICKPPDAIFSGMQYTQTKCIYPHSETTTNPDSMKELWVLTSSIHASVHEIIAYMVMLLMLHM